MARRRRPAPSCQTSHLWYWREATEADKASTCCHRGPYAHGSQCVCRRPKGHDGEHLDTVANLSWEEPRYCPSCHGSGRVKESFGVNHPASTRSPREWPCEKCNGSGRIAA